MERTTTKSLPLEPVMPLSYGDNASTMERRMRKLERRVRFFLVVLTVQSLFVVGYICAMIYIFDYITRHYARL